MHPNQHTGSVEMVRIIPPVNNTVNVDSVQRLIGQLYQVADKESFSLELVQQHLATHLLITAPSDVMPGLLVHVRQTYPQAQIQPLSPEQDPARPRAPYEYAAMAVLRLKERSELSLQTTDDLTVSDTLQGLMALAGTLESHERTLAQLVLRPAPNPWSGLARARSDQVQLITVNGRLALLTFLSVSLFVASLMTVFAGSELRRQHWAGVLWACGAMALSAGSIGLTFWLWPMLRPLDGEEIMPKVRQVGFEFTLRLAAFAASPERAQQLFRALRASYGQFDLAGGNSLLMESRSFDPTRRCLEDSQSPFWLLRAPSILSATEVACLWHLPLQVTPAMHMSPGLYRRLVPPRALVTGGHPIGAYEHQGRELQVHLPKEAMASHILVLGKSQRGKSALLQRLASFALADRNRALIVIDPHADLARAIAGSADSDQAGRMIYWDLHDMSRPIGFNLLEPSDTRRDDKTISDVVDILSRLWRDNWGPRMEDSFRWAARCLIAASRHGPRTYTLLDINRLLSDGAFRRLILNQLDDPEALRYFEQQFEGVAPSFRDEIIHPVQSKINRFINNELVKGVFGQPQSGLDLQVVLDQPAVLLISTHKGSIGPDAASLIGSAVLGQLRSLIAEREAQSPGQRRPVTILVNEAQTLTATTFEGILSEVAKYGCNLILATQTLSLLDSFDPALRPIMLSNQSTLISFETSAEDASDLVPEFDEAVTVSDLINLPRYTAYAKTFVAGQRTPVFSFTTLPPAPLDDGWAALKAQISADLFGRPRSALEAEWQARELAIQQEISQMLHTSGRQPPSSGDGWPKDGAGRRPRPGVGGGPHSAG